MLLNAFAIALMILLGVAGECLAMIDISVKHHQAAYPLVIPARLYVIRIDPHNIGGAIAAFDRSVHHDIGRNPRVPHDFAGRLKKRKVRILKTLP